MLAREVTPVNVYGTASPPLGAKAAIPISLNGATAQSSVSVGEDDTLGLAQLIMSSEGAFLADIQVAAPGGIYRTVTEVILPGGGSQEFPLYYESPAGASLRVLARSIGAVSAVSVSLAGYTAKYG